METRFFQFCRFLNLWNNLDVFYNHLVLTGRLSTHLDSIFTKNPVSTLPNTFAARVFMRVEIGNWHYKTQLGFIVTISKNVQDRVHSLISIPAIITAATLKWVEIDFLELKIFLIDATMPLCHDVDAGVYKWPFHFNSQSFLSQWLSWKCWAGFHPLRIILTAFVARILRRVKTCEKIFKKANQCLFFFFHQRQNIAKTYAHTK